MESSDRLERNHIKDLSSDTAALDVFEVNNSMIIVEDKPVDSLKNKDYGQTHPNSIKTGEYENEDCKSNDTFSEGMSLAAISSLYRSRCFFPRIVQRRSAIFFAIVFNMLPPIIDIAFDYINAGAVSLNTKVKLRIMLFHADRGSHGDIIINLFTIETAIARAFTGSNISPAFQSVSWAMLINVIITPMVIGRISKRP